MKATVAERGQVTIPKVLRQRLGIKQGTVLDFEIKNDKLVAIKTEISDKVKHVYGCLGKLNTDAVVKKLRGES